MNNKFNIVVSGVGGQGIITLLKILTNAALADGYDVKSSELHGLSQREGSVKTHIKIGKNISSPLIIPGETNLVIGLETQEALRSKVFAGNKTIFLVNNHFIPIRGADSKQEQVEKHLKQEVDSKNLHLIDANSKAEQELNNPVLAGMLLLGYAQARKILPLSQKAILQGVKTVIGPKYLEMNKKALQLAKKI